MKRGLEHFKPELTLAKEFCKSFPTISKFDKCNNYVDIYYSFARIKDIPAIRKIIEASYTSEAIQYIDKFFNRYK
jgi:hypothetical protein